MGGPKFNKSLCICLNKFQLNFCSDRMTKRTFKKHLFIVCVKTSYLQKAIQFYLTDQNKQKIKFIRNDSIRAFKLASMNSKAELKLNFMFRKSLIELQFEPTKSFPDIGS